MTNASSRRLRLVLSTVFLVSQFAVVSPALGQFSSSHRENAHTAVRLVADVQWAAPGSTFTVGILLQMEKGWHTYWKNSGEAGLPTTVTWELPAGLVAGDILWPVPTKHIEAGDILTYGYADETMLLVPITVSGNIAQSSKITLKASVSWLECERTCIPGSTTVELELPVTPGTPQRDNKELFARYRQLIPVQASTWSNIHLHSREDRKSIVFTLSSLQGHPIVSAGTPDFYPEANEHLVFGRTTTELNDRSVSIRLPLSAQGKIQSPLMLRGIVVYTDNANVLQAGETEITLPVEFCASLSAAAAHDDTAHVLDQPFALSSTGESQPLALYLLFALVGGLLLNIMPCVLPVIALKVFGLVRLAGNRPAQIRRLGWVFSLGILASFLLLAILVILLKTTGQEVGWGFQFQEPLFVIAMSAVVFAFGLSLFGVFEIRLPGLALSGVNAMVEKQATGGKGYTASFAEGMFATILATPCTAPFLGTALGFAFAQPWWMILLIFTTIATGMALPYLLLTSQPAWMKYLPKPGEWMETAKQFMGFLMMATLLWLLYILGKQLGMEGVIWTSAFLLVIGFACWLIGRFATLIASRRTVAFAWIVAVVVVGAGYWLFIESILDVRSAIAGTTTDQPAPTSSTSGGIDWKPFVLADLEHELQGDKIVFVDFTAEWCLTCKVNERTVLADHAISEQFKSLGVLAVRADWTKRNPTITRLLQKFGRSGVPLYVIFPPGRRNAPIVLPEVITSGIVLEALQKATSPPR